MSAVCEICGGSADGETMHKGCVWCYIRRGYICRECSERCPQHMKDMLPNGTHCLEALKREPETDKLLKRPFPASATEIDYERNKYKAMPVNMLFLQFMKAVEWYDEHLNDRLLKPQLPAARARITAMQLLLQERKKYE